MTSPRTFRLQFSLRALLVPIALVGVAIVVYRWPWEVESVGFRQSQITTQYHRGWNGKPVKHGLQVERIPGDVTWHSWFEEGELRNTRLLKEGVVTSERHHQGGKRHGPYWGTDNRGREEGQFHQDLRHGAWKCTSAETVVREEWSLGKRHGRKTWTTVAGRLLQSAEYEQGHLVKWNDRPLADELNSWFANNVPGPELRQLLVAPVHDGDEPKGRWSDYREVQYFVDDPWNDSQPFPPRARRVCVQWQAYFADSRTDWVGRPIAEALLEEALEHSQTFAFRFNLLHVIPITAASLDWQDRTGVNDVEFPPGSAQEKFWLQPTEADPILRDYPPARLLKMIAPNGAGPLAIDTTVLHDPEMPLLMGASLVNYPHIPRLRRDLLGQHLNREGLYCEQRGNTLVIKRHE